MVIGYLGALIASAICGGLVLALSLLKGAPFWLLVMAYMAAAPIFALLLMIYLGGCIHVYQKFAAPSKETGKELQ